MSKFMILIIILGFVVSISTFYTLCRSPIKETFTESQTDDDYEQRISFLRIIDSMNIEDKAIKGILLEKLFSKESLLASRNYDDVQKKDYIDNMYKIIRENGNTSHIKQESLEEKTNKALNNIKNIEKEIREIQQQFSKKEEENYREPVFPESIDGFEKIEHFFPYQ